MNKNHRETIPLFSTKFFNFIGLAFILIYFLLIATYSYYHYPVGQYMNVEHDFYNWYAPDTKKILNGNIFDIEFYDIKGIGYHFVLALFTRLTDDIFKAGKIISPVFSGISLFLIYKIFSHLFNPLTGILIILGTMANNFFIISSYTVGTDMFFLSLILGAINSLYLSKGTKIYWLSVSGFLSGYAYFTRYNGIFLILPAIIYLFFQNDKNRDLKRTFKGAIIYLVSFILTIIPWHIFLYLKTGNPLFNRSYRNLAYDFIYEGYINKDFYWQYLADNFHSASDVFFHNPLFFISKLFEHGVTHFYNQINSLMFSQPLKYAAIIAILYFILKELRNISKKQLSVFLFATFYYIVMLFIHYEDRYFIFLVPFFIYLISNLFLNIFDRNLTGNFLTALRIIAFLLLIACASRDSVAFNFKRASWLPTEILYFGDFLKYFSSENNILIARSPNITYYGNIKYREIPLVSSTDELVRFALKKRGRFLYFSNLELRFRPKLEKLIYHRTINPNLYPIMEWNDENKKGILYYIVKNNSVLSSLIERNSPLFRAVELNKLLSATDKNMEWFVEAKGLLKIAQGGKYNLAFSAESLEIKIDGKTVIPKVEKEKDTSFHKRDVIFDTGYHSVNISFNFSKNSIFPSGLFWEKPDGKREKIPENNLFIAEVISNPIE